MEITPELITQFGLMNKISTGHSMLDVMLCLLVPFLLQRIIPFATTLFHKFFGKHVQPSKFQRSIEYTQRFNYWDYYSNDQPPNSLLQRAILNYINVTPEVMKVLSHADYELKKGVEADKKSGSQDDEDGEPKANEHAYGVNTAPPDGTWVELKGGLRFMRESESVDQKAKNRKTIYHLESSDKDGNEKIDKFVEEALELYKKQQTAKVDLSRYLYVPVLSGFLHIPKDGDDKKPAALYKRYKLSEEKTFSSFFHPEKQLITNLVDQFCNKKGKFSIPGYPQKLGFLLYGPPGTGKTSFIKALGQYTKRSIISIPLSKISTNQELMDIMFDQKIQVEGEESTNLLPFSKTIFVMEDVDAASSVVQRRDCAAATEMLEMRVKMYMKSQKDKTKASASKDDMTTDQEAGPDDADDAMPTGKSIGPSLPRYMGRSMFGDDELNLSGLLNVLDGVVDTPNRIIIMTTNHPEKLDPALIRPGRINKKIYLGRMRVEQAKAMMGHYFGAVPQEVVAELERVFVDEVLSPADLESMCADYDGPHELVKHLAVRFGGVNTPEERIVACKTESTNSSMSCLEIHEEGNEIQSA